MVKELSLKFISLGPLTIRIALAVIFIYHGYSKVFAGGHAQIAELMASQGAPYPQLLGWLAGCTEFFGGCLLLIGLLSRIWALGLMILMAIAIATVHGANGFDVHNSGYEYCLALLLAAASIFLGGPGSISLDHLIFRKRPENISS
jgi:putative oxidoreductase